MVRIVDFDRRSDEILKDTIELYLETAQPVSSEILVEKYKLDWSPATVRNILKDLEEKGLLTHPYTSAGRIPTDKGYHYYIKHLMAVAELSDKEKEFLDSLFETYSIFDREDSVLDAAIKILTTITHYASLYAVEDRYLVKYKGLNYLFEQPEFKSVEIIESIIKALEEGKFLELLERRQGDQLEIWIGKECYLTDVDCCSLIVSNCSGGYNKNVKLGVLGPKRMAYNKVVPIIDYLANLVSGEL